MRKYYLLVALLVLLPARGEDILSRMCATYGSPSTCTAIPANTWIDVTATGATTMSVNAATDPSKSEQWYVTAWDKAYYVPLIDAMCLLGSYRTHTSEPNEAFMCHQIGENRLNLWALLSSWHNEEFLEGAHPMGIINIDPTTSTTIGQYGYSCAQVADCPRLGNHREDFLGQVGRSFWPGLSGDSTNSTASLQVTNQLGSAAYDPVAHTSYGLGGASSTQPFWSLDRDGNLLNVAATSSGSVQAASTQDQSFAYDSLDGKIYVWGGDRSGTPITDLYRFAGATGVWERLDATQTCNVSQVTGLPACPPGRSRSGWTYDANRNVFMMFGGCPTLGIAGCTPANDVWQYDPIANAWTQLLTVCTSTLCSGGAPSIHAGTPTNERFQYIPELDVYWDFENLPTGSSEQPHFWFYRRAPGPPVGYLQRFYNYSSSTAYAAGASTGSLNRFTLAPTGAGVAQQSWALGGGLTTDGNGNLWWGWSETSVVDTYTASVAPYLHPYVSTWSAVNGLSNVPSAANSFSIYNGDSGNGLNQIFDVMMSNVGGAPWACYTWVNPGQNSTAECKGFNGTSWALGGALPKVGTPSQASDYDAKPYLVNVAATATAAWIERDKNQQIGSTGLPPALGYVAQFTGGAWSRLGPALNTGSLVDSIALITDGTTTNLFAAYTNYTPSLNGGNTAVLQSTPQLFLKKWNSGGGTWDTQCGGAGNRLTNGKAFDVDGTWLNGQPYLTWLERTGNSNTPQLIVATCSAGAWSTVVSDLRHSGTITEAGHLSGAMGWPMRPRITNDGTNLYLAWSEQNNGQPWLSQATVQTSFGQKARVFAAQVTTAGVVTYLGGALNLDPQNGSAKHPAIAMLSPANPVVFWTEVNLGNFQQGYIKQWNGTDWIGLSPPVFTITTGSPLPNGINGTPYSVTITTANATGNLTACSGDVNLPAWATVTFSGTSCTIAGTPTSVTAYSFTITATDSGSHTASQTYSLTIVSNLTVTTSSPLPQGTEAVAYSTNIVTTGGSGMLSTCVVFAGTLPSWASLSLSGANCVISGTPNLVGTSTFTLQVQDTSGNTATSPSYQLTIVGTCAISTASPLNPGTIGSAFSQTIATMGCVNPLTWSNSAGLDSGLSPIGASTGTISGTPAGPAGTDTFTISVTDADSAQASQVFTQVINAPACTPPTITTASLPNGTLNQPYSATLAATGTAPITWSATGLPGWAILNTATGAITGTPNAIATSSVVVTATNACGAPNKTLSLQVTNGNGTVIKGKMTLNGQAVQ